MLIIRDNEDLTSKGAGGVGDKTHEIINQDLVTKSKIQERRPLSSPFYIKSQGRG